MQTQNQVFAVEALRMNEKGSPEVFHVQCVEREDQISGLLDSWIEKDGMTFVPQVEMVWLQ